MRSPSWFGTAIRTRRAWTSSRRRAATRSRSRERSVSETSAFDDLVQRLELLQPAGRGLVEPCVLDRDCGLGREQRRQFLVLVGERHASRLLGEVEVSVRDPAEQDRDAEERAHRRVVRRGSRPSADPARSSRRRGFASWISAPRIPRPRGRSPIAAFVSSSIPVTMNSRAPARWGRSRRGRHSVLRSARRPPR